MTPAQLTGRERGHVVDLPEFDCAVHRDVGTAFAALRRSAAAAGHDLAIASAFRDFDRQLAIWNGKFTGDRPLFDAAGRRIDAARMPIPDRIEAILRWSALPGASRHHWGTDFDLYDRRAQASPRLDPAEYAEGGPYAALGAWLDRHARRFGFFRPYRGIVSGVHPEPWHYSFAPLADSALRALTVATLRRALEPAPLAGKDAVLGVLESLHDRYVARIDPL